MGFVVFALILASSSHFLLFLRSAVIQLINGKPFGILITVDGTSSTNDWINKWQRTNAMETISLSTTWHAKWKTFNRANQVNFICMQTFIYVYLSEEKCHFLLLLFNFPFIYMLFCVCFYYYFIFAQCILVESRIIILFDHFHVNNLCLRIV